jgi:hyperosmotically inducible protein
MKKTQRIAFAFLLLCSSSAIGVLGQSTDASGTKSDNTKVNRRDRKAGEVTADQQKMNKADRQLTQKIRRAINDDKSLSTYAHNVKIISQDGLVTLKGPVRTDEERTTVEAKATGIAGSGKVTNELSVAPKSEKN